MVYYLRQIAFYVLEKTTFVHKSVWQTMAVCETVKSISIIAN